MVAGIILACIALTLDLMVFSPDRVYVIKKDRHTHLADQSYAELAHLIENKYYRQVELSTDTVTEVDELLNDLDEFTRYFTPKDNEAIKDEMKGNYKGIGVNFFEHIRGIAVVRVKPDSPAHSAGIEQGDIIIAINGSQEDTLLTAEKLSFYINQQQLDSITLVVDRATKEDLLHLTVYPDEVVLDNVATQHTINDTIAYIKLDRFGPDAYREFMTAIENMFEYGEARHLIIDLRQNGGGLLKEAVNMLSQLFKEKGKMLVYTEGRNRKRVEYTTTGKNFYDIDKIAVIIDAGSASASEIIAGTIQDLDRGLVVGTPSFGKGLVQEHFNLSDGSGIRLTVASYYLPSGRSIQKPDGNDDYDIVVFKTAKGRTVYNYGGITPDVSLTDTINRETALELMPIINTLAFDLYRSGFNIDSLLAGEQPVMLTKAVKAKMLSQLQTEVEVLEDTSLEWAEAALIRQFMTLYLSPDRLFEWQKDHDPAIELAVENLFNTHLLRPQ